MVRDERWFTDGSGKTTLLQWVAVTAARSGFSGSLADLERVRAFPSPVGSYADRPLPRPKRSTGSCQRLRRG